MKIYTVTIDLTRNSDKPHKQVGKRSEHSSLDITVLSKCYLVYRCIIFQYEDWNKWEENWKINVMIYERAKK